MNPPDSIQKLLQEIRDRDLEWTIRTTDGEWVNASKILIERLSSLESDLRKAEGKLNIAVDYLESASLYSEHRNDRIAAGLIMQRISALHHSHSS